MIEIQITVQIDGLPVLVRQTVPEGGSAVETARALITQLRGEGAVLTPCEEVKAESPRSVAAPEAAASDADDLPWTADAMAAYLLPDLGNDTVAVQFFINRLTAGQLRKDTTLREAKRRARELLMGGDESRPIRLTRGVSHAAPSRPDGHWSADETLVQRLRSNTEDITRLKFTDAHNMAGNFPLSTCSDATQALRRIVQCVAMRGHPIRVTRLQSVMPAKGGGYVIFPPFADIRLANKRLLTDLGAGYTILADRLSITDLRGKEVNLAQHGLDDLLLTCNSDLVVKGVARATPPDEKEASA